MLPYRSDEASHRCFADSPDLSFKAQEKKLRMEEKRKKMAAAAALLCSRNADGYVFSVIDSL